MRHYSSPAFLSKNSPSRVFAYRFNGSPGLRLAMPRKNIYAYIIATGRRATELIYNLLILLG